MEIVKSNPPPPRVYEPLFFFLIIPCTENCIDFYYYDFFLIT